MSSNLIVKVDEGQLKGQRDEDIQGSPFLSFMGIPYAKPPIGDLRFKTPQPLEKWNGIRDATKEGGWCYAEHPCPTPNGMVMQRAGSEDCLYLNVFTHELFQDGKKLKPVMVFIHGGAFIFGSSSRSDYGPEFLMTENIVLVTLNYRLGILGFLKMEDPSLQATGNMAFKDMVLALKWVQKNIKQFCGDPKNVTIFGESAGAAAVHTLVLSPLAQGLFHKAIIQSGSALCPWNDGINDAKQIAKLLNCVATEDSKIFEFLQNVTVEELLDAYHKLVDEPNGAMKRPFCTTIEPKLNTSFLYEKPWDLIQSGTYNHVPLLFGYNTHEGAVFTMKTSDIKVDLNNVVPHCYNLSKGSTFEEINRRITAYYAKTEHSEEVKMSAKAFTDMTFLRGIYQSVKGHAQTCKQPVYYYRMSLDAGLNFLKPGVAFKFEGACHADDLGYLFKNSMLSFEPGSIEETYVRRFVKLWTNFARFGNPIPAQDSLLNSEWKPVSSDELNFLDIGKELIPGINPDVDRMHFWDELSKELKSTF